MTLDPSGRPVLMAAWSAGLAPLKAILLQLAAMPAPPAVHLFTAARRPEGLYDMPALEADRRRVPVGDRHPRRHRGSRQAARGDSPARRLGSAGRLPRRPREPWWPRPPRT